MITIIAFTIVLGVLIFFHELGHFLMAKANGVFVEKFSLGFGPALLKKQLGETEYRLAAIPLGGYVKMLGENDDEENPIPPEMISRTFGGKSLRARAVIVAAGPVFNLILAILIYTILAWSGMPAFSPVIGEVQADTPAAAAGLEPGDRIIAVEQQPTETFEDIGIILEEHFSGQPLQFRIQRDGTTFDIPIAPEMHTTRNIFGEEVERPLIGIMRGDETFIKHLGPLEGIGYGFTYTWRIIELTFIAFGKMFDGTIPVKESLGGPIMIAQVSGQTFRAGALPFFSLIAFISINLALINLLPIPVLDGGFLLLFLIEAIIGRPVEGRPREIAQQIGLFLLIMLMFLAFYNDIARLVGGG